MKLHRFVKFFIFTVFLISNTCAQFSAYHGIVFPYDGPNKVIHSIGSITYAFPDPSADVQNNPVGLSFIQHPQIFINLSQDISKYYISISQKISKYFISRYSNILDGTEESKTLPVNYSFYPEFFSVALPVNVFKRKCVFAGSINKILSPEHEVWLEMNENYANLNFNHQREGNVYNAALGLCYQLAPNINVGIGWNKWFGHWSWYDENISKTIYCHGHFDYYGNNFNLGLLSQYQDLSVCFIFHFPFTLMKAENIFLNLQKQSKKYNMQQHFNGAFKAGVAYRLNNRMSLSAGYRFQGTASKKQMETDSYNHEIREEYDVSHQISIASEYILNLKNSKLPIFLACWVNWIPETMFRSYYGNVNYLALGYQIFSIGNNIGPVYNIAFGFNVPLSSVILHFTGQWYLNSINGLTSDATPGAARWSPVYFEAKKSTFMINVGISHVLKSVK